MERVKRIYHVADIHIRLYERHDEYRQVFDRFFDVIRDVGTQDSVICILGDIVDAKTEISNELVRMVTYFLKGCADLCPTILVPGNHDALLSNPNRMDTLTPVVEALNHPNLMFSVENIEYKIGNVSFSHMSVMDDPDGWIRPLDMSGGVKIGMYHGPVFGATTDLGFSGFKTGLHIEEFDGFDMVLLGDIHRCQSVGRSTVAYPGSLIQQGYAENLVKGILIWDVAQRTYKFREIKNDYGYYTFTMVNNRLVDPVKVEREHVRYRLQHQNSDSSFIHDFVNGMAGDFHVVERRIKPLDSHVILRRDLKLGGGGDGNSTTIDNRNTSTQMGLIVEYLKNEKGIILDDLIYQRIKHINEDLNARLVMDNVIRDVSWTPLIFKFSNMFSYGEGNIIDFRKLKGVIGIFAKNASGKSSIIDAILFCLFDKCDRTNRAGMVLNNKKEYFKCYFEFLIGNVRYSIERIGQRKNNGNVSVTVNFIKYNDADGTEEILTGSKRSDTNKVIRRYLGIYEDYILTVFRVQNDNRSFISMTQRDRQILLYRFLDIYTYPELFDLAKDESKELQTIIKFHEEQSPQMNLNELIDKLAGERSNHGSMTDQLNQLVTEYEAVTGEIEEKASGKVIIDESFDVVDEMAKIRKLEGVIADAVKRREPLSRNIKSLEFKISRINLDLSKIDVNTITQNLEMANSKKRELDGKRAKCGSIKSEIDHCESLIGKLETHEYDPDCKFCMGNQFVRDAVHAIKIKEQKESELVAYIVSDDEYADVLVDIEDHKKTLEMFRDLEKISLVTTAEKTQADSELSKVESVILISTQQLEASQKMVADHSKLVEPIEHNRAIDAVIRELKIGRDEINDKLGDVRNRLTASTRLMASYEAKMDTLQADVDNLNSAKSKYEAYEYYLMATGRNGVPYSILKKLLPAIESQVNNLLSDMVKFTFKIGISDDEHIDAFIVYDGDNVWPVELVSGFERFMLSSAIRNSLISLSSLPKPNFMAIDEGFGSLDSENFSMLETLFDSIRDGAETVFCISHINKLRDYVDDIIVIDKVNGFSKINVT